MITKLVCRVFKLVSLKELSLIKEQYEKIILGLKEDVRKRDSEIDELKATLSTLKSELSHFEEEKRYIQTTDVTKDEPVTHQIVTKTKTKRKRIAVGSKDIIHDTTPKQNETRNLTLTESFDIASISKKSNSYTEVINHHYTTDPQIISIIKKLSKIKLKVTYKNGGFYYLRKGQEEEERLPFIHFEEYNNKILLLFDGKYYCGYDMGNGQRASERNKDRIITLSQLDTYYEKQYIR